MSFQLLELWGMQNTTSLPSLPGPLWSRVVALYRALSMGQIELNCVLILNLIVKNRNVLTFTCVFTLNWIVWNRTVLTLLLNVCIVLNNNQSPITYISGQYFRPIGIMVRVLCVWTKTVLNLNWIVWIRTVKLNWIAWNRNFLDN